MNKPNIKIDKDKLITGAFYVATVASTVLGFAKSKIDLAKTVKDFTKNGN